jgi:hypothetical protein
VEWALNAVPIRSTPESKTGISRFEASDWPGVEDSFRALLKEARVDTPTYLFLCLALIHLDRLEEAGEQLIAAWKQELADSEPSVGS